MSNPLTVAIEQDLQEIILGNWLIGDHREDLDMFQPYHFGQYAPIVEELKRGTSNQLEICKKTGFLPKVIGLLQSKAHYEDMYIVGVLNLQKKLAEEWIAFHPEATPDEIAENMERFTRKSAELPSVTKDPVEDVIDELDRLKNEKIVTTGLTDLDAKLCGVRTKELTAVGARPSVGKSALLMQIAMKVASQGKKVLFFPLEMSESAIIKRMFMRYTDIPQYEMRNGLSRKTWEESAHGIDHVREFMEEGNFKIFERCNDISTIKRLVEFHKPYMIAIDQLEQLRDGNQKWTDIRQRFSHMTHEMQAISLDMDVAVWFACQVNRGADDTPPTMANLKESGTIEEDSTNVLLLHRKGDKSAMQDMQLELAKQKDGECGVLDLKFDAPHFTFRGIDWKY